MKHGLAVLALAACGDIDGVSLTVIGTDETASIELLVAPYKCQDKLGSDGCPPGIAWDTAPSAQPGDIFFTNELEVLRADIGADGRAHFRIESDADAKLIRRLVVIGYDASGAQVGIGGLHDVTIPVHRAEEWQVELNKLPDIPRNDPRDTDRYHVWRQPKNAKAACLALEIKETTTTRFEFLVPEGDPDCDGLEPDCASYAWSTAADAGGTVPHSCLVNDKLMTGVCTLGNTVCTQTGGACEQDGPPETCLPNLFCKKCITGFTASCEKQTAMEAAMTDMTPHINCRFDTTASALPCTQPFANNHAVVRDLDAVFGALNATCNNVEVIPLGVPVGNPTNQFMIGSASFKIARNSMGTCTFDLLWDSGMHPTAISTLMLDVTVTGSNRHMLFPMQIEFPNISPVCPTSDRSELICNFTLPPTNTEGVYQCASL